MTGVHVSEPRGTVCAKDMVLESNDSILKAHTCGAHFGELGLDVELVIKSCWRPILERHFGDRPMNATSGPRRVCHAPSAEPFDARYLHVFDVTRVVSDSHQVCVGKSYSKPDDAASR